mmetsp:Transcript_45144/g.96385  ORF Transcript_45144/g.96385 Transcript_45144/m.96385 type:complete len:236 (-) Transcript_45144:389-1096(-)
MQRRGNAYPHTDVEFPVIQQQRAFNVFLNDPRVHPTGGRRVVSDNKITGGPSAVLGGICFPLQLGGGLFLHPRQHISQLLQGANDMDAPTPGHHRRLQDPDGLPPSASKCRRNTVLAVERSQLVPGVVHSTHSLHGDRLPRGHPSELHVQQLEGLKTAGGGVSAYSDGKGQHVKGTLALVLLMDAQISEKLMLEGDFGGARKPADQLLASSQLVPGHMTTLYPLHVKNLTILRLH